MDTLSGWAILGITLGIGSSAIGSGVQPSTFVIERMGRGLLNKTACDESEARQAIKDAILSARFALWCSAHNCWSGVSAG